MRDHLAAMRERLEAIVSNPWLLLALTPLYFVGMLWLLDGGALALIQH